ARGPPRTRLRRAGRRVTADWGLERQHTSPRASALRERAGAARRPATARGRARGGLIAHSGPGRRGARVGLQCPVPRPPDSNPVVLKNRGLIAIDASTAREDRGDLNAHEEPHADAGEVPAALGILDLDREVLHRAALAVLVGIEEGPGAG